jgi:hypothetical protein
MQQKILRRIHQGVVAAGESGCALMRYAVVEENGRPKIWPSTHCVKIEHRLAKSNTKGSVWSLSFGFLPDFP